MRLLYPLCFILILLLPLCGIGQIIFPNESGIGLLDHIRADYSPSSVLSLARAKDTIYANVDNVDGRVFTIYCDHSLDLPDGVDPSVWMFEGPSGGRGAEAINLEHVYPQSKGAEAGSQANMDMHHLYPTRASVNVDRASFPFTEIDDNQTSKWYLYTDMDLVCNPISPVQDLTIIEDFNIYVHSNNNMRWDWQSSELYNSYNYDLAPQHSGIYYSRLLQSTSSGLALASSAFIISV